MTNALFFDEPGPNRHQESIESSPVEFPGPCPCQALHPPRITPSPPSETQYSRQSNDIQTMFVQLPPSSSLNSVIPSTSLPSQEFSANNDYSITTTASLSSATASVHCSKSSFFLTNLFAVDSDNDNFVSAYLTCVPPHPPTLQTLIKLCASIPPSLKNPPTPLQVAGAVFSAWFARNPLVSDAVSQVLLSLAYKKVANKTRPVATTLPENFRIV